MRTTCLNIVIGTAIALAAIVPSFSKAAEMSPTRLFANSQVVVRDRFSNEVAGNGPDLVFIPGLASSRATWKATAERLKDKYRLHLIQVAGFAGEPARANASGPVLIPTADAIDGYLVEQHLAPATVIGHSLGGTIALYLAEHHPDHLKKVMLVDTLPFFATLMGGPKATVESIKPMADAIRSGASKMTPEQRTMMMKTMATSQADRDTIAAWGGVSNPTTVSNATADDLMLDMRAGLAAIPVPMTLLVPDYVALGRPPGANEAMYRSDYAAVPHMTFVPVTNSLHFVMFDQPAQFNAAIDSFLKS